jgi:hypothetical protein
MGGENSILSWLFGDSCNINDGEMKIREGIGHAGS